MKLKSYHLISWLLIFLNIAAQYIFAFLEESRYKDRFVVTGLLLLFVFVLLMSRKNKTNFFNRKETIGAIYLFICVIWIKWSIYEAVAANIIFFLLYLYSVRKFEVLVQPDKITYPSFPKKMIQWNELQNIILKDGILTIDFKNNKLLQNELDVNGHVNEKDFNEFCRQQLNK
ncbi:MAG: hypothetical protein ABIR18_11465 [Chitinophagaceae bacterium]